MFVICIFFYLNLIVALRSQEKIVRPRAERPEHGTGNVTRGVSGGGAEVMLLCRRPRALRLTISSLVTSLLCLWIFDGVENFRFYIILNSVSLIVAIL